MQILGGGRGKSARRAHGEDVQDLVSFGMDFGVRCLWLTLITEEGSLEPVSMGEQ